MAEALDFLILMDLDSDSREMIWMHQEGSCQVQLIASKWWVEMVCGIVFY